MAKDYIHRSKYKFLVSAAYFASKANATIPAAIGADADVPV